MNLSRALAVTIRSFYLMDQKYVFCNMDYFGGEKLHPCPLETNSILCTVLLSFSIPSLISIH